MELKLIRILIESVLCKQLSMSENEKKKKKYKQLNTTLRNY